MGWSTPYIESEEREIPVTVSIASESQSHLHNVNANSIFICIRNPAARDQHGRLRPWLGVNGPRRRRCRHLVWPTGRCHSLWSQRMSTPSMDEAEATSSRPRYQRAPPTRSGVGPTKAKNVVMASHGRAPWYGPDGKPIEAYVIGIAGGSASGKVSLMCSCAAHIIGLDKSGTELTVADLGRASYLICAQLHTDGPDLESGLVLPGTHAGGARGCIQKRIRLWRVPAYENLGAILTDTDHPDAIDTALFAKVGGQIAGCSGLTVTVSR